MRCVTVSNSAILVQYTLATWDEGHDAIEDRHRPTLEAGLAALCGSIVTDAAELSALLDTAAKRQRGAR